MKAQSLGFTICPFSERGRLEEIIKEIYGISMRGFQENFLFEDLPFEMFRAIYVPIFHKGDLSLANFAVNSEGVAVGFNFSFSDGVNYVCKSLGVFPEARGKGLSNAMVAKSAQLALDRGLKHAITALVRTGIQSESYAKKTANSWRHEYALLTKGV